MVRAPIARAGADHREGADRGRGIDGRIRARPRPADARPRPAPASGDSTCAARANVRYGDGLRITAHGRRQIASPFMITALALVDASFEAYLGLARNVRSPGPASSIFATRRISMAASPSTGHSKRRASSPSVTRSRISLLPAGLRPGRQAAPPSARRTGPFAACAGDARRRESGDGASAASSENARRRSVSAGSGAIVHATLCSALHRAAPRQEVADHGEGKQVAEDVRARDERDRHRRRSAPACAGSADCDDDRRRASCWRA